MSYDELHPVAKKSRLVSWIPRLGREDRLELTQKLDSDASWSADFSVMMGLSTALATLGLQQNSTAVVIGAMLVAPLMSPLIGVGMAVVQGNVVLFRRAAVAMGLGVLVGLAVSIAIGFATPQYEATFEIEARGEPNILDLAIALVSGMAAAYAMARPKVIATLAGVAIAAALVPPLAVVGLAVSHGRPMLSGAAAILLLTNIVAIAAGAAIVFRLMGVAGMRKGSDAPLWARRAGLVLILASCILVVPLGRSLLVQAKQGQARPLLYPVSRDVRMALRSFVEEREDLDIFLMARTSNELDLGVTVAVISESRLDDQTEAEIISIVKKTVTQETRVRVIGFVGTTIDTAKTDRPDEEKQRSAG